jgi:hypothetical protein
MSGIGHAKDKGGAMAALPAKMSKPFRERGQENVNAKAKPTVDMATVATGVAKIEGVITPDAA